MTALLSHELSSVAPAAEICCADAFAEYTKRKKESGKPDSGERISKCYQDMMSKLGSTPCGKIQEQYAECLSNGGRFKHTVCFKYREALQECTAKHLGKLD